MSRNRHQNQPRNIQPQQSGKEDTMETTQQVKAQDTTSEDKAKTVGVEGAPVGATETSGTEQVAETKVEDTPQGDQDESASAEIAVAVPVVQEHANTPAATPVQTGTKVDNGILPYVRERMSESQIRTFVDLPSSVQSSFIAILTYIDNMKPGAPMSIEKGTKNQKNLYDAITVILNNSGTSFRKAVSLLLSLFKQHSEGALAPSMYLRFILNMSITESDKRLFDNLLNLFHRLREPDSRTSVARHWDLTALLFNVGKDVTAVNQTAKDNLIAFFTAQ